MGNSFTTLPVGFFYFDKLITGSDNKQFPGLGLGKYTSRKDAD
jgi:hypothetical protein